MLNRAYARARIFAKKHDYQTFEQIMAETADMRGAGICGGAPLAAVMCIRAPNKSFPVQVDAHFLTVCRYVERNVLRARPRNWVAWVNQPQSVQGLEGLRLSVQRGRPCGDTAWQLRIAKRLGLESTFHSRGRPRKR
jgi:hypothetical protein